MDIKVGDFVLANIDGQDWIVIISKVVIPQRCWLVKRGDHDYPLVNINNIKSVFGGTL